MLGIDYSNFEIHVFITNISPTARPASKQG